MELLTPIDVWEYAKEEDFTVVSNLDKIDSERAFRVRRRSLYRSETRRSAGKTGTCQRAAAETVSGMKTQMVPQRTSRWQSPVCGRGQCC